MSYRRHTIDPLKINDLAPAFSGCETRLDAAAEVAALQRRRILYGEVQPLRCEKVAAADLEPRRTRAVVLARCLPSWALSSALPRLSWRGQQGTLPRRWVRRGRQRPYGCRQRDAGSGGCKWFESPPPTPRAQP